MSEGIATDVQVAPPSVERWKYDSSGAVVVAHHVIAVVA
jgi:hypothetical protein